MSLSSKINYIKFDDFCNLNSLPRNPDNGNICIANDNIDYKNSFIVFISHTWLRAFSGADDFDGRPHPDNSNGDKFALCKSGIKLLRDTVGKEFLECYIWMDYGCINQDYDPAAELRILDRIIELSDIIFIPIVDKDHHTWELVNPRKTDCFLAHNWGAYNSNHERVQCICEALRARGIMCWFGDAQTVKGDVWATIKSGIDNAKVFVIFLTSEYLRKVTGDPSNNCRFEFEHALKKLDAEKMIPVVMEPEMLNPNHWKAKLGAVVAGSLYVDFSNITNSGENFERNCDVLAEIIRRKTSHDLYSDYKAAHWNRNEYSYLNRAWIRMELLYASQLPLDRQTVNTTKTYRLAFPTNAGKRGIYLYGSKEMASNVHPISLPPLDFNQFSPDEGVLGLEMDRQVILNLIGNLKQKVMVDKTAGDYAELTYGTLIARALEHGKKEWRRSKIMLVGEGLAGKTSLANAILGKVFDENSQSTAGINELVCDVAQAYSTEENGKWNHIDTSIKTNEFETALARILADTKKSNRAEGDIVKLLELLEKNANNFGNDSINIASANINISDRSTSSMQLNLPRNSVSLSSSSSNQVTPVATISSDRLFDENLIMKCLGEKIAAESSLVISLYDFGGQSIFNSIHQFFLTKNGVYIITFDMEKILSHQHQKECLYYIRFWLNSVIIYTATTSVVTNITTTAPILLIGTHKDIVSTQEKHEQISTLLQDTFLSIKSWSSIVKNKENDNILNFYPIDNKKGQFDPTLIHLIKSVEAIIEKSPFTHREVPLSWLSTLDKIKAKKRTHLLFDELIAIATKCGVSSIQEMKYLLIFFHDMGILMWINQTGLNEIIIIDPISYLVKPASIIICENSTLHRSEVHELCELVYPDEWENLNKRGILHEKLLPHLWKNYLDHQSVLILLLIKFGLLVLLKNDDLSIIEKRYLVPALLPIINNCDYDELVLNWSDSNTNTCFYVLSSSLNLQQSSTITQSELLRNGFFPEGLFERIIGKTISWCQNHSILFNIRNITLRKNLLILPFGTQRFRLISYHDKNCIRVDIEGINPLAIHERLLSQINSVIQECMSSLICFPALLYSSESVVPQEEDYHRFTSLPLSDSSLLLLPLDHVREVVKHKSILFKTGGRNLISSSDLQLHYHSWIQSLEMLPKYDFFLSYRWGVPNSTVVTYHDSVFASGMFDTFSNYTINEENNRGVDVFLDSKRLKLGDNFQKDFITALTETTIVIPLISVSSIDNLKQHNPNEEDNLLLEWIIALCCYEFGVIKKILPIIFGSRTNISSSINSSDLLYHPSSDFYDKTENHVNNIADIIPTATMEKAIFHMNRLKLDVITSDFKLKTVRMIVKDLLKHIGVCSWKEDMNCLLLTSTEKAMRELITVIRSDVSSSNLSISHNADVNDSRTIGGSNVSNMSASVSWCCCFR